MFTVEDRQRLHDRMLELADADSRVVAGAVVGSLARGDGDRWSDLDLTFGVRDGVPIEGVLEDWTRTVIDEFGATPLFDLPAGPSIYRVFLVPDLLQFDLSFTPASAFGAIGPDFRLLFGTAVKRPQPELPTTAKLFGYAVHHALRARFCIERGRYWNAEYWISAVRDYGLSIACVRLGVSPHFGKGFDDLPGSVREPFVGSLVASFDREELLRALGCAIDGLLRQASGCAGLAASVEGQLRSLAAPVGVEAGGEAAEPQSR